MQVWKDIKKEKPADGARCIVVFEDYTDKNELYRWIGFSEFNNGEFDLINNHYDDAYSVGLPSGSIIQKIRAICWCESSLSEKPVFFDEFYDE